MTTLPVMFSHLGPLMLLFSNLKSGPCRLSEERIMMASETAIDFGRVDQAMSLTSITISIRTSIRHADHIETHSQQ